MYDNMFKSSNTIIIYREILVDCFWKKDLTLKPVLLSKVR